MKFILSLFFILSLISPLFSQNVQKMDSLIREHFEDGFNGNVLYARNDSILYNGNFGVLSYATNHPLNDSSIFELGSNAKQITAVATVQLIEKGLLTFDTKVDHLIEGFPYSGITVEHLLRHQSGLPSYMKLMRKKRVWNRKQIAGNHDVLNALIEFSPKLNFEPGSRFKYSNTGYVMLVLIIEKVSGLSFNEYLSKYVFEPADMKHSAVIRRRYRPVAIENNTEGYILNKKSKQYEIMNKNPKYWCSYLDGVVGDGSISSTALDMLKWNSALKHNRLLTPTYTELLFTPDSVSSNYGLGFFIDSGDGERNFYHQGTWAGYQTWTYDRRESNEYIVVLSNNNYSKTREILRVVLHNL